MKDRRFDQRTKAQFKQDIQRAHNIQGWLLESWIKEMAANSYCIEYQDNGTDNSGRFTERASSEPDYVVSILDKLNITTTNCKLEVKTAPHYKYLNFKVESLKAVVEHNAHVLLFIGVDTKAEDKETLLAGLKYASWCFFSPKTAEKILTLPARSVPSFYGGKPCIEIKAVNFDQFFTICPFGKPIR